MKRSLLPCLALGFFPFAGNGEDQPVPADEAVFLVPGMECGGCVYLVQYALGQTPGVAEVEVGQNPVCYARVSFDPKQVSEHQIAQAVRESISLHGTPYLATLKLRVPDYAQGGNGAKVKALFERWKEWVELKVEDEAKGELAIQFLPLKTSPFEDGPCGWSYARLTEALQTPAPKGLGLACEIVDPTQP